MKPPKTTIKCYGRHGGNRHLTPTVRNCYECDGCGANYTPAQVEERKSKLARLFPADAQTIQEARP